MILTISLSSGKVLQLWYKKTHETGTRKTKSKRALNCTHQETRQSRIAEFPRYVGLEQGLRLRMASAGRNAERGGAEMLQLRPSLC